MVEEDWSVLARFMTERAIEERWAECRKLQIAMTERLVSTSGEKEKSARPPTPSTEALAISQRAGH